MSRGEAVVVLSIEASDVIQKEACACRTCGILFDMGRAGKERTAVWSADEGRVSMRKREEAFRVERKIIGCGHRSDAT